jgi:hypothetical protein
VSAARATILVSNGGNAEIDLAATGKLDLQRADIASAEANFARVRESSIGFKVVATPDLTPLFRASGIQKRFLREAKFRGGGSSDEDLFFETVDYANYGH